MVEAELQARRGGPARATILLVEDNEFVREAMADTMRALGYQVFAAAEAREALDIASRVGTVIDLVVSDLVMPGMNALELYEALKTKAYGGRMLIVTGYPMPRAGSSLAEQPGVAWAEKPIRLEELRLLLAQLLERPLV